MATVKVGDLIQGELKTPMAGGGVHHVVLVGEVTAVSEFNATYRTVAVLLDEGNPKGKAPSTGGFALEFYPSESIIPCDPYIAMAVEAGAKIGKADDGLWVCASPLTAKEYYGRKFKRLATACQLWLCDAKVLKPITEE